MNGNGSVGNVKRFDFENWKVLGHDINVNKDKIKIGRLNWNYEISKKYLLKMNLWIINENLRIERKIQWGIYSRWWFWIWVC